MYITAIIAAGGRGQRVGSAVPKQLLSVGGRPILERTLATFIAHPSIDEIVVALPAEIGEAPPAYLRSSTKPLRAVIGGAVRQSSVANAFRAMGERGDLVVIHDAARPFASAGLISRTIAAAAESGAALAALPASDTVKRTDRGNGGRRFVRETLPRETIFLAQTPQAFRREVLLACLALAERDQIEATDEAALAERAGHRVAIVDGESTNIKITTADDLPIAEAIAAALAPDRDAHEREGARWTRAVHRVGVGYDLHRLVEGRPLVIGGVTIPAPRGALGHSDADVVCHAITDAILGAASLGDIGRHFPDADPQWKDASSLDLLARTVRLAAERGFAIANADVTVVLESPKLRDRIDAMRANIARVLGIDAERVSIKGKTNEGVDAIGRGDAIAAHAVVLLIHAR